MTNAEKRSGMTRALELGMIVLLAGATAASAHEATGVAGGFASGFLHPLLGWDHIAAMVAVGLWGAFLGTPAIWLLPIGFMVALVAMGAVFLASAA